MRPSKETRAYDNVTRIERKIIDFLESSLLTTQFIIYRSRKSVFCDEHMKLVFDNNFHDILKRQNKLDVCNYNCCNYTFEVLRNEDGTRKRFIYVYLVKSDSG